jgi:16S rRNA (cytosine1402-N4)-methyltransferase
MDPQSNDSLRLSRGEPLVPKPRRRPRYSGKYPRRFDQKYKEHNPERFSETVKKVLDGGKTPAGTHRPILVEELLALLAPKPGEIIADCTLGYGGHAQALLPRLVPGGRYLGLDQDPIELPRTEARLRAEGFGPEVFTVWRSNFAGLGLALGRFGVPAADIILADLGVSSMQLDNPARGFSIKHEGPLDMRMNPGRGQPASAFVEAISAGNLAELLAANADEPFARQLGAALAGRRFETTLDLAVEVRTALSKMPRAEVELSVRRTFQALRIAVNGEFSALEALLRQLPACLTPGGRVALLSFHSGEDRRIKKAFATGLRDGVYSAVSPEVIRPTAAEQHANPRSTPAKLRWAVRGPAVP